ncbi:MAG: hypothetical protein IPI57_14510 [Candidatus Competibacteraceae bacterium]|nr:hypothetical protein [Candidatus Competibacteraceae bacterium]
MFGALVEMSAAGHGVDGVTVAEFLKTDGQLDNGAMSAIFVARPGRLQRR